MRIFDVEPTTSRSSRSPSAAFSTTGTQASRSNASRSTRPMTSSSAARRALRTTYRRGDHRRLLHRARPGAALGRAFPESDTRANVRLAILSHRLWRASLRLPTRDRRQGDSPESHAMDDRRRGARRLPARRRRVSIAAPGRDRGHLGRRSVRGARRRVRTPTSATPSRAFEPASRRARCATSWGASRLATTSSSRQLGCGARASSRFSARSPAARARSSGCSIAAGGAGAARRLRQHRRAVGGARRVARRTSCRCGGRWARTAGSSFASGLRRTC